MDQTIVVDSNLVAACGLYCGACRAYLRGRCPGCAKNDRATWCKVRTCTRELKLSSCAQCPSHSRPADCNKFNNVISKVIGFVLRSDRAACIEQIRALGLEGHAEAMAASRRQTIRR